ncbi:hypothetical protein GBF38_015653 [Nibea albiflora]|uniref:Uncharacterized protein n=1 Tax=Nibea albiflora TaxID=240163 RepID=A0ACB7EM51_NIBAL|nr:hypothetical protein GBF38_015653 [Nibea albiflora]
MVTVAVIKQEHIKEVELFQVLALREQRVHLFSLEDRNSSKEVVQSPWWYHELLDQRERTRTARRGDTEPNRAEPSCTTGQSRDRPTNWNCERLLTRYSQYKSWQPYHEFLKADACQPVSTEPCEHLAQGSLDCGSRDSNQKPSDEYSTNSAT